MHDTPSKEALTLRGSDGELPRRRVVHDLGQQTGAITPIGAFMGLADTVDTRRKSLGLTQLDAAELPGGRPSVSCAPSRPPATTTSAIGSDTIGDLRVVT